MVEMAAAPYREQQLDDQAPGVDADCAGATKDQLKLIWYLHTCSTTLSTMLLAMMSDHPATVAKPVVQGCQKHPDGHRDDPQQIRGDGQQQSKGLIATRGCRERDAHPQGRGYHAEDRQPEAKGALGA
jgi:hypothetical protein